jgi:hypothetical protein
MKPDFLPAASGSWPDGAAAAAYLSRVQSLLDAKGLDGSERAVKPLLRKIASAFQGRDFAGVRDGCDALIDVLSELPAPPTGPPAHAPPSG